MQSVPTPNEEPVETTIKNHANAHTQNNAPTQNTVPEGLVGLVETAVLGAIVHGLGTPLKRKISLVLKAEKAEDDIEISKHGGHHIIHGTHAVIDIDTCEIIGYLENEAFVKECSDYVKSVCAKYNVSFRV